MSRDKPFLLYVRKLTQCVRWLAPINRKIVSSVQDYSHLYPLFGWYCVITYPAFYFIWHIIIPQPFNPPIMRIIAVVLGLGLILSSRFPDYLRSFLPYYWYATLIYNVPFFFAYQYLSNHGSVAWELNMVTAVFLMLLLTDWLPMIILSVVGCVLACVWFWCVHGEITAPPSLMLLVMTMAPIIVAAILFIEKKARIYKENIWLERINSEKKLQAHNIIEQEKQRFAYLSRHDTGIEAVLAIAHEINQPISAITNYISGCQRIYEQNQQKVPPEIISALEKAKQQAKRAGDIIHNIKDLLVKDGTEIQYCQLTEVVYKAIDLLPNPLAKKDVRISTKFADNLPFVVGSLTQLTQVVINLIENASDAIISSDSVNRVIEIEIKKFSSDSLLLSINNHGDPIPKEKINTIFMPFVTSKTKGLGLGLSLCYNIIQSHGGNIYVESSQREGTTFNIILPIERKN